MPGPYCRYCDQRCFVSRKMPDDATWRPGETVHLATCVNGAAHDREETGHDYTTAINPALPDFDDMFEPWGDTSAQDSSAGAWLAPVPAPDEEGDENLVCRECGEDMWIDEDEVSHHWGNGPDNIDHDLDEDHVAIADED